MDKFASLSQEKKIESIRSYAKIVWTFQQCMLKILNKRAFRRPDGQYERDLMLVMQNGVVPLMQYYETFDLKSVYAAELISTLYLEFTFWEFEFTELPVKYKLAFDKMVLFCVWWDDQLDKELRTFYKLFMERRKPNLFAWE